MLKRNEQTAGDGRFDTKGAGVAKVDGLVFFVENALLGMRVLNNKIGYGE